MRKYTEPKISKGPKPTKIPKGSTLEKEWAKNVWLISYTYDGKQYRHKEGLNRIHDPIEKRRAAEDLRRSIQKDLENGYDPSNPTVFDTRAAACEITLDDAVEKYLESVETHLRRKSVGSYRSKLKQLCLFHGKSMLKELSTNILVEYIQKRVKGGIPLPEGGTIGKEKIFEAPWSNNTVKAARRAFNAFLNWCIQQEYISENPASKIENRLIRSEVEPAERNNPFTKEDAISLLAYLDENTKHVALFCRVIYYTCLRPKEIRALQLKHVDLERRKIFIPTNIMKNTQKDSVDIIDIPDDLYHMLNEKQIDAYPANTYLFTSDGHGLLGKTPFTENYAYNVLRTAIVKLGLSHKGYNLYSFKHYANIQRIKETGWDSTELMKLNRHTSLVTTEKYLKKLRSQTDISQKPVPKI